MQLDKTISTSTRNTHEHTPHLMTPSFQRNGAVLNCILWTGICKLSKLQMIARSFLGYPCRECNQVNNSPTLFISQKNQEGKMRLGFSWQHSCLSVSLCLTESLGGIISLAREKCGAERLWVQGWVFHCLFTAVYSMYSSLWLWIYASSKAHNVNQSQLKQSAGFTVSVLWLLLLRRSFATWTRSKLNAWKTWINHRSNKRPDVSSCCLSAAVILRDHADKSIKHHHRLWSS